jgi:hypothetical protein
MTRLNVIIRNSYLKRFKALAKNEFNQKTWSNWKTIESMNNEFLKEEKNDSDLKEFKKYCDEFRPISNYYWRIYGTYKVDKNNNVYGQNKQLPTSIESKWNYSNANTLIGQQPSANKPITSTTYYEKTRKSAVQESLHTGHVAFIDALIALGREELKKNPTEENYRRIVNILSDNSSEIIVYQNKAKSLYGVSNSVVTNNFNRWSEQLSLFHKIVEDAILEIG